MPIATRGSRCSAAIAGAVLALAAAAPARAQFPFDGGRVIETVTGAARPRPDHASWSPDGSRVVYHRTTQDGSSGGLFISAADGSGTPRALTADPGDFDPAWSPDGSEILFVH